MPGVKTVNRITVFQSSFSSFFKIILHPFKKYCTEKLRIPRRETGHFALCGAKPDASHFVARNRAL